MSMDPKAVELRIPLEILNEGKLDVIDEVMSPEMIEHMPATPGAPAGIEGFKLFVRAFREAFPDLHYEVVAHLGEGEMVATAAEATGTMKGDFAGMPATGKKATWTEIPGRRGQGCRALGRRRPDVDACAARSGSRLAQLGLAPGAPVSAG